MKIKELKKAIKEGKKILFNGKDVIIDLSSYYEHHLTDYGVSVYGRIFNAEVNGLCDDNLYRFDLDDSGLTIS